MYPSRSDLVFAFADPTRTLRTDEEHREIQSTCKDRIAFLGKHGITPHFEPAIQNVLDLKKKISAEQLLFFSFSGHAYHDGLLLDNGRVYFEPLRDFFLECLHLKCVFLNGCNTWGNIDFFHKVNVPIVIATSRPVPDHAAILFSESFFRAFVKDKRTVRAAYRAAIENLNSMLSSEERFDFREEAVSRGLGLRYRPDEQLFGLYYLDEGADLVELTLDQLAVRHPGVDKQLTEGRKYHKLLAIGPDLGIHRRDNLLPPPYYLINFDIEFLAHNEHFYKKMVRDHIPYIGWVILIIHSEKASDHYSRRIYQDILLMIRDAGVRVCVVNIQKDEGALQTINELFHAEENRPVFLPADNNADNAYHSPLRSLDLSSIAKDLKRLFDQEKDEIETLLSRINFEEQKSRLEQLIAPEQIRAANLIIIEGEDVFESGWELLVRYLLYLHGRHHRPNLAKPTPIDHFDCSAQFFGETDFYQILAGNLHLDMKGKLTESECHQLIVENLVAKIRLEVAYYWIISNVTAKNHHLKLLRIWQDLEERLDAENNPPAGKWYWIWLKNHLDPIPDLEDCQNVCVLRPGDVSLEEEERWVRRFNEEKKLRHIYLEYQPAHPMSVKKCIRKYCRELNQIALENVVLSPSKPY